MNRGLFPEMQAGVVASCKNPLLQQINAIYAEINRVNHKILVIYPPHQY